MDFFPFYNRPYYYDRNRYINSPYSPMQGRRQNQARKDAIRTNDDQRNGGRRQEKDMRQEELKETRISNNMEAPIFEIFGLKLFFDDILIIALIFFLYNEGVRDNLLFISLILILLS